MPQLGETVTEGTITRWAKQVGDRVEEDEVLFEVSTDKVDSEVPSPVSGFLSEILVEEGQTVDVGTRLAVVSDQPASGDGRAPDAGGQAAPADAPAKKAPAEQPDQADEQPAARGGRQASDERAEAPSAASRPQAKAEEVQGEAETVEAAGGTAAPGGQDRPPSGPTAPLAAEPTRVAGGPAAEGASGEGPAGDAGGTGDASKVLSPVVRRLLSENGLDPADINGTGAGGRITRADVLAAVDARRGAGAPAGARPPASARPQEPASPAPRPAGEMGERVLPFPPAQPGPGDEVIPFSNIRRRTAEHMIRSRATSAHTLVATEVDYHAVEAARAQVKDLFRQNEGFTLTYLPFISRAVIDALEEFPNLNASVGEDTLIVHPRVHLGIAVDLNLEGLIVPVIREADSKRLRALSREIRDLAERARAKRLSADEIQGGTFTITNPGPFGTFLTGPVINQPQVAILSTDGIKKRPVVVETPGGDDAIVVHPVGLLSLTWDHRAVDGAYASAFLARCREIIETRDWIQEL